MNNDITENALSVLDLVSAGSGGTDLWAVNQTLACVGIQLARIADALEAQNARAEADAEREATS